MDAFGGFPQLGPWKPLQTDGVWNQYLGGSSESRELDAHM